MVVNQLNQARKNTWVGQWWLALFCCMNYGEHVDKMWTIGITNHVQTTVGKSPRFVILIWGGSMPFSL